MSVGAGFSSKTAWKKEDKQSAYSAPIEVGASDQMPLISETLERGIEKEPDNTIRNKAGAGAADVVGKTVTGRAQFDLMYRGLESLLHCALGHADYAASPATVAAGVYKHTIELAERLHSEGWLAGDGILAGSGYLAGDQKVRRGTLCIDKAVSLWEYASCMIQALTLTGSAKGLRVEADLVPYNLDRASAVNTTSAAWSIPDLDWLSVLFQDLVVWIDDYSAGAPLTSDDAIGITDVELKLENNLKVEKDSLSGLYIAEPKREAKRRVTGSFTMPRYESDAFLEDLDDQTAKMAMLKFTGSQIGSTGYYLTLWLWLPSLKFDKIDAPVAGPKLIPVKHTFTAELPAAAPAGFPAQATKELVIQIQNDFATNALI